MTTLHRRLDWNLSVFVKDEYRFRAEAFRIKLDHVEPMISYELSAYRKFFEDFYPSVFVVATKCLSDKAIAEKLSFETFTEVMKRRKKFQDLNEMKNFIYSKVREKCIRYLKNRKNSPQSSTRDLLSDDYFFELILEEETYSRVISMAKAQ